MKWNWEHKNWPNFEFDSTALEAFEMQFLSKSGMAVGVFKHLSESEKNLLKVDLISEEALKTSKIEGELLNRDSLQASLQKQFGLQTDHRKIPPAEQGISAMMVDLYETFHQPLTTEKMTTWHTFLMKGRTDLQTVGIYRQDETPMQVVSGPITNPKVHFEAPPSSDLNSEMKAFLSWFNESHPTGKNPLHALTRAGIAHLYFVSIHPFEDGNGRVARALSEKSLAQSLGHPTLISLSHTLEKHRKKYYAALEENNKDLEITPWLLYFSKTVLEAQETTQERIEFVVDKAKFYDRFRGLFNERQEKVVARLFREGIEGFRGGLSAENYRAITGAPRTTTTRDLNDLVEKGALLKTGQLRYTRYALKLPT